MLSLNLVAQRKPRVAVLQKKEESLREKVQQEKAKARDRAEMRIALLPPAHAPRK
jgi:hypothetical protein